MEIQEITVRVAPDGTVKLEVRGVKGQKCLALTADLEKLLGGAAAVLERVKTPELDQQAEAAQTDRNELKPGW